ncbi:hypothetical protein CDAR_243781 [Caerostris darwini]|uniref:Uncharacterized protein n=1 Tax=Caerostris darwini TaxID=1538125 RepID=A0AAV4N2D8_9ARAC|nr:hypothetical protein CDAR_243781 [Caerostris darwini]
MEWNRIFIKDWALMTRPDTYQFPVWYDSVHLVGRYIKGTSKIGSDLILEYALHVLIFKTWTINIDLPHFLLLCMKITYLHQGVWTEYHWKEGPTPGSWYSDQEFVQKRNPDLGIVEVEVAGIDDAEAI